MCDALRQRGSQVKGSGGGGQIAHLREQHAAEAARNLTDRGLRRVLRIRVGKSRNGNARSGGDVWPRSALGKKHPRFVKCRLNRGILTSNVSCMAMRTEVEFSKHNKASPMVDKIIWKERCHSFLSSYVVPRLTTKQATVTL